MKGKVYALLVFYIICSATIYSQSQFGEIQGKVLDARSGKPLVGANVVAFHEGTQKGGASSNIKGKFTIKPLEPGSYTLMCTYIGKAKVKITGVVVKSGKITFRDIKLKDKELVKEEVVIEEYKEPLIEQDNNTTGGVLTEEEIQKAPTRDVNLLAGLTGGVSSDGSGTPNIKGGRNNATIYYVDGVRVRGLRAVPQGAISQMNVITGGVPAQYGDATGGVISITTRGPSQKFHGGGELITSQFLDAYGYNLFEGNLSGPLFSKYKNTDSAQPVLGFLVAGEIRYRKEPNPSPVGYWKIKENELKKIQEKPLRRSPIAGGFVYNSEFMTKDEFEHVQVRPNVDRFNYNITGKIDYQLSDNINLTAGGQMGHRNFNNFSYTRMLFNYPNYDKVKYNTYRGYLRYTHSFGEGKKQDESGLNISNAFYSLQVDYTRDDRIAYDPDHGSSMDNIFEYGHYGKFNIYKEPVYQLTEDTVNGRLEEAYFMAGYQDTLVEFTPSETNPVPANYTEQYYELENDPVRTLDQIKANRGLVNGDLPDIVYSLWTNVGVPITGISKSQEDQFRFTANGSANLNNHAIKLGIQYEQRTSRFYGVSGTGLWSVMRTSANRHILQLDTRNPIPVYDDNGNFLDSVRYKRLDDGSQTDFDKNLRKYLIDNGYKDIDGNRIDNLSYINVDRLDPEVFQMDFFSADELLRTGVVSYRGYSYTGEKLKQKPGLDDFFNNEDERLIAPYNPVYIAGYIQDKFSFKDLIFRLGLRVDRFDANQPVLKDRYSLYPTRKVAEVKNNNAGLLPQGGVPGNIGDDHVVYVDDPVNPQKVIGYRKGDNWYNVSGEEVVDPNVLAFQTRSGIISPYLQAESEEELELTKESFTDYEPQIFVLPRIAFSFPISEDANFYANYDILSQRPRSDNIGTPDDYFYLEERATGVIPNPNLKPQTRTNYEVGFKQRLSGNSALELSAYYGEIRNMIQRVRVNQAYPISYTSFDNIDFGTVKGFTVSYDLRRTRTNNAKLEATYTLQFADGTGSNPDQAGSLISAGQPNLRTLIPLNYDVRHDFTLYFDYRFGSGRNYNGPLTNNNTQLLANTGVNVIFRTRSGKPYSQQSNITQDVSIGIRQQQSLEGGINAARRPWIFNVDLRVDRDFTLIGPVKTGPEGETTKRKPLILNAYVWVQNLFDTRNITGVYRYTGTPDDDGFLASAEGQEVASGKTIPQAFMDQYSVKLNDFRNYMNPRLIRLGLQFHF